MTDENLQIENGNFTRIINPVIDELVKIPFKGCELAVALFLIRRTYGFNKKQDSISLTQFEKNLKRGRPTINKALKNLQLVNIVTLAKRGNIKGSCNIWAINKYTKTWGVVKGVSLVKGRARPSEAVYTKPSEDGLTHKRKKDIIQKTVSAEADKDSSFNFKEYLKEMSKDTKPHIRLIAYYFHMAGSTFDSRVEVSRAISRHSPASKKVLDFGKPKISKVMEALREKERTDPIGWTLETVFKYLTK